ncbi:hypothetical protein ILUMI_05564 [Ignelater luminosus]|uniref:Uncharacterized protein n=1 Tax=Ignelater luminosus TaxID=2038154 RepID=A0A8K0DHF5_IGNLU|nr:hypothetical protein ILUMI_05564 [Ignelater luminosus]
MIIIMGVIGLVILIIIVMKFMPESTPQAPPPQVAYNPALTQQVQGPPQVGAPATAAPAQAAG